MPRRPSPAGPGAFGPDRGGPLPSVPDSSDWFPVRIVSVLATTPVGYTFIERWLDGTAAFVDKTAGRQNTSGDLAYAIDGSTFAADDLALCRRGPGAGGLLWELAAMGGAIQSVNLGQVVTDVACVGGVVTGTKKTLVISGRDLTASLT